MIGLPSSAPVYLYTQPVDFRKGFDGLTGIVTTALGPDVTDGSMFLFVNRKRDRIKALWWETGGLTLLYRRPDARLGGRRSSRSIYHHGSLRSTWVYYRNSEVFFYLPASVCVVG